MILRKKLIILPLSYFEAGWPDYIIVGVQGGLQSCNGLGFGEIGEEKVDTIQVGVSFPCFVLPLDAVGQRNHASVENLDVHATSSNKQLHNVHH